MDSVEEPSYLGGSPRRPLPTTSIDHADLVSPMMLLDLSASEDDEVEDVVCPVGKETLEASNVVGVESVGDENDFTEVGKERETSGATGDSTPSSAASSSTAALAADAKNTAAAGAKTKKTKPAARTVPSRYMEAGKPPKPAQRDQTRQPQKPATPQRPKTPQRSTPQRTTPLSSKNQPTSKAGTPSTCSAKARSQSATTPSTGSANARSQSATTPSTGSSKPRIPSVSTPSTTARSDAAGGGDTPKSSKQNEDGGLPQKDLDMINWMMARTKRIAELQIEAHRKAYLEQATSVLAASAVAIGKLCGQKNENLLNLFKAQCESKIVSLNSATKDILMEKSLMDQTKANLTELEQALLSKGRDLEASGIIELPMSDDSAGQAVLVRKLVQKLKTQMEAFHVIDHALPPGVRVVTQNLAVSLGELDRAASATTDQINECARHLRTCLFDLVEFLYESRKASKVGASVQTRAED